jgi:hypothetical protein
LAAIAGMQAPSAAARAAFRIVLRVKFITVSGGIFYAPSLGESEILS